MRTTPEELVKRLRNGIAPGTCDLCQADSTVSIRCDRGDCEWEFNLKLAAADLIESQRNAVIEECAKKCDEAGYSNQLQPIDNLAEKLAMAGATLQAKKLAIGIRALKDDSAVPVERQCES